MYFPRVLKGANAFTCLIHGSARDWTGKSVLLLESRAPVDLLDVFSVRALVAVFVPASLRSLEIYLEYGACFINPGLLHTAIRQQTLVGNHTDLKSLRQPSHFKHWPINCPVFGIMPDWDATQPGQWVRLYLLI